jgi:hypothetical protein
MLDGRRVISSTPKTGGSGFDRLIERWNALRPSERQERARACVQDGHRWVNVVGDGVVQYVICRHCCRYDPDFGRD